jgi:hypothetical protein
MVPKSELDGKKFRGELIEAESEERREDVLEFRGGKLCSSESKRLGFGESPYELSREGDRIVFRARCQNARGDELHWHGSIHGESAHGTAHTIREGKPERELVFQGRQLAQAGRRVA